jgi:site-specific recombinase XerD
MEEKIDLYASRGSYEQELKRVKKADISEHNKDLIRKWGTYLLANNRTPQRVTKLSIELRKIAQLLKKDFESATRTDIEEIVTAINSMKMWGKNISPQTMRDYKITLKMFYKWLLGNDEESPVIVRWVKLNSKISEKQLNGRLITTEDIKQLLTICDNDRDRAFISLIWETGSRIGEMLNLKIKDFNNFGSYSKVRLYGKTGERNCVIIYSVPYLNKYLDLHPNRENSDAYLWYCNGSYRHHKNLNYIGAVKLIKRAFLRAKINKKCNPHIFRHSRATEMARHLTEQQMCLYFGWVMGSKQIRTYVHASGRDVDDSILKYYGVKSPTENTILEVASINCPRCKTVNASNASYCQTCGMSMNMSVAMETEKGITEETNKAMDLLMEIAKNPMLMKEFEEFKKNNV